MRIQSVGTKLIMAADLPDETLPGMPVVEIAGDQRVLIEHHNGVVQYSEDTIRLKVKFGQICVSGRNMRLMQMTKGQLVISGTIESVHLLRGC